jgi:hypothetical protein
MSITKELYDDYVKKSFFTQNNINGKKSPNTLSNNMIKYENLQEFHYQTSFFLNLYASLYIELINYEGTTISYNITKFANTIENLGIILDNNTDYAAANSNLSIFTQIPLNNSNYTYTFYIKTFERFSNTQSNIYKKKTEGGCYADDIYYKGDGTLKGNAPVFGNNPNLLYVTSTNSSNLLRNKLTSAPNQNEVYSSITSNNILNKTNYLSYMPDNKSKLKEILGEIFSQTPENILGYLLYKKIYYNIILFNISIQNSIRLNYLNEVLSDSEVLLINTAPTSSITSLTPNISNITSNISMNTNNITDLNNTNFSNKNDFLLEKNQYSFKINTLNTLRTEYSKIQDKLNISTKLYNQQFKNYKSIKTYATYIIIALILILILIISISIFPIFSLETKNALYIILLVILIVITFLYYTNFKYVNLYEKFAGRAYTYPDIHASGTSLITFSNTTNLHKNNNIEIYNYLLPFINKYMNAYNDILNNMRLNVYTIGSKTYSQDANIYLYNMYLEKKRQIEVNNIKLTNLFNMIEIIKKQITYLFNIIFLISCFSIILLIALVIYSIAPQLYIFIIILCVILISMLMIYFSFAIIQPTRMIENKNYWASLNPSKFTYSKL